MISLKKRNIALDTLRNMSLSIERTSPIWFGDDVDNIGGIVTIPFDLPLTQHNAAQFGFIHHLGNRRIIKQFEDYAVFINQNQHLTGTLEIEQINDNSLRTKIYSGVGGLQVFKNNNLTDPTLYTTDTSFSNTVADMNNALTDGDIIYLPFLKDNAFWNDYDVDTQSFLSATNAVPFVSAIFLLEKLIEGQGWALFFKEKETYRYLLYMICNQAHTNDFTLSEILPDVTPSEFIKELAIMTGHYIDIDNVKKVIAFRKYEDLGKGSVTDLTEKIVRITNQEFLEVDFSKDCAEHTHILSLHVDERTYTDGPIEYNRQYIDYMYDINTIEDPNDNLEKISFVLYQGLRNSEVIFPIQNGNAGDIEALNYPFSSSQSSGFELLESTNNGVKSRFQTWIDTIEDTRILTTIASLTPDDIQNITFNKIIRILNLNDGNYYNFLIKTIKQSISIEQHELAELELVLI